MMKNSIHLNKIWLWKAPRTFLIIFLLILIVAALLYPGGTIYDKEIASYSIKYNFLSDMGRTIAINGENNFFSSSLFLLGLSGAGVVILLFFIQVWRLFSDTKTSKALAIIGTISGVLGCLCLIGVAFTPVDLFTAPHIAFANWLFRFFFLSALAYTIAIILNKELPNQLAIGYLIFSISIISYILINELGPSPSVSKTILAIKVIAQKAILIIFVLAIYFQSTGLKKVFDK
jgi:hypothetical protein